MCLQEFGEMYLETILILSQKNSYVRSLDVAEETASEDACKIEHDISDKSFEVIKAHAERYRHE